MFFSDWGNLVRTVVVGALAYAGLVVMLRASGNRTLSKMNSFDLVVTIAFGSILASALTGQSVNLAQGLVALGLLIFLQFIITWLSVRFSAFNHVIKTKPTLLLKDGRMLEEAMRSVRVTADELCSAARREGYGGLEQLAAVILESDGSLSVIRQQDCGSRSALTGIRGLPD